MLKKAGIVVATAAAGLLALSPLALAGNGNTDHHDQKGLVNVQDIVVQANACDNNVNVLGVQVADLTGAIGLLSPGATTAEDNDTCKNASDN